MKATDLQQRLAEAEQALSRKDHKIEGQQRRLRKANRLIEFKDQQLTELGKEARRHYQDVDRLTRWAEGLDSGVSTILRSRRWKVGNFLGNLRRGTLSKSRRSSTVDSINEVSRQFRAWKKNYVREPPGLAKGKGAEDQKHCSSDPASAPTVPRAEELTPQKRGPERDNGIKKVQVGCGPHNLMEDWWNVDIREFRGIDAVMDATKPWPYEDLEYVFGEHFLEHLTLDEAVEFIKHAGNSLRHGGVLRLSTPNLEWVLRTHYDFGKSEPSQIISDTLKTNRAFHGWGHKFLYSRGMMAYVLTETGFEEVSFFGYGESNTPELRELERHGNYSVYEGQPSVIVVEARKGTQPVSASPSLASLVEDEYRPYVRPEAH